MLVFMIGMPGAGKTTLGAALAQELGFSFLDLDDQIEQAEQRSIAEIFTSKGEAYFRQAEARELRRLQGLQHTVVATGGGTPCFLQNISWMNERGLTVFLDVPLELLALRLEKQTNRPLFTGRAQTLRHKLHETLSARKRYYEQAAVKVAAENLNIKELAQLVREILEKG